MILNRNAAVTERKKSDGEMMVMQRLFGGLIIQNCVDRMSKIFILNEIDGAL